MYVPRVRRDNRIVRKVCCYAVKGLIRNICRSVYCVRKMTLPAAQAGVLSMCELSIGCRAIYEGS